MAELGALATALAFGAAVYGAVASAWGAATNTGPLIVSGRRGLLAAAGLTTLAVGILVSAFLIHDFSLRYVWQTSSRTTPVFYLFTGLWGGQAGSLLFWSWLTGLFGAAAVIRRWRADAGLMPWFTATMSAITSFYLFLVVFVVNPFERLAITPPDGNGLNPLLQHPGMAFHPPSLYLGLTGLTVPFAFAIAALASRRCEADWLLSSRRWTLVGWAFLAIGLSLGGRWAYDVLGWGGYWGWDPVENAALMPWLAATAFLHSVMVQERLGMFRVWNMGLVILTYALTVIGTFLTRAGLVSSVHAFAQSDIGPYFLAYVAVVVLGSLALLYTRLADLRDAQRIETVLSRETAFLANNVFLLGALFAIFWGTLFPLFSELLIDQRVTVGPPYFNRIVLPIMAVLILLMAIGPLLGWRKSDIRGLRRDLAFPLVTSLALETVLWLTGVRQWIALVGFGTCLFALLVTLGEFAKGIQARRARGEGVFMAVRMLILRNRRRYGGYVVHIGVILLAVGVVGSNIYQEQAEKSVAAGESFRVGAYTLTYLDTIDRSSPDAASLVARLQVFRGGSLVGRLEPTRQLFRLREDQPRTIPSVMHRPLEDVYAMLAQFDPSTGRATFKVFVNPLISFVWLGMIVLVLGTLVAAWPDAAEQRVMDAELKRLLGGVPA